MGTKRKKDNEMDGWGDGYAQEDDDEDKSLELTSDQFEV
jgi:hypothetical protein